MSPDAHGAGDYQTRYPIDFPDIDPAVRSTRGAALCGRRRQGAGDSIWPPRGNSRTAILMAHPRADFAHHYTIPYWVEAGFAACALNTRYLNNDTMMLHENLILDVAAAIRFLREEEGFERIVMLGNSGGGSLFAYYDAQARAPRGERVAAPPGGGPPDLNRFALPAADGLILLAAHPGQGMVLMGSMTRRWPTSMTRSRAIPRSTCTTNAMAIARRPRRAATRRNG